MFKKKDKTQKLRQWAIEQIPKRKFDSKGRVVYPPAEERMKEAEKLLYFIQTGHYHNFGH